MGGIAVVGSLNQDQQWRVATIPRPGETTLARGLKRGPGGKGANQAVAIARADGSCVLVGAVGDDQEGVGLLSALRTAGVDTTHVLQLKGRMTGAAAVLVDDEGQNCIVVSSGANMSLDERSVSSILTRIGEVDTVLTQGEVSVGCISACAAFCRSHDTRLVINLAPYSDVPNDVLSLCDPLIVNEVEAEALGVRFGYVDASALDLARMLTHTCRSVIITLGKDGAVYADGVESGHISAPEVTVVDTTGAGDAFVGAATVAVTRHGDLDAACRAGVRAGSRAVQHHGAQTETDNSAGSPDNI